MNIQDVQNQMEKFNSFVEGYRACLEWTLNKVKETEVKNEQVTENK